MRQKLLAAGIVIPAVLVADLVSKKWALEALAGGRRMQLFDGWLPLTLAFNRGAAFGLSIGDDPRWFFVPVTLLALGLLIVLLVQAEPDDHLRHYSVVLVIAGAVGNLYDRVRWDRGVVDFIGPVDLGFMDWPIFNVADMAISTGAVLLAVSFWIEEHRHREAAGPPGSEKLPASPESPAPEGLDGSSS